MYKHIFGLEQGEYEGACTSILHNRSHLQPMAKYYDTSSQRWLCFSCAQSLNQIALRGGAKRPCYSHSEYMMLILKGEINGT